MAENSSISWTDHTFNPWWGCTKVGPGCDHCYAESFDKRVGGSHWGVGAPRRLIKDWSKPLLWDKKAQLTGIRPWVFCASMADVFDNEVPREWRDRLWDLVRKTPNLNWIFVTKRIGNAAKMLPADWRENFRHCGLCSTIVNQDEFNRDVPKLLDTPSAWRGLSMEPLLGPVDLSWVTIPVKGCPPYSYEPLRGRVQPWATGMSDAELDCPQNPRIDWVIVGGESGHHFRDMREGWALDIMAQCQDAGTSFHFKQRAGVRPKDLGRLLDGKEHNGMPPVAV